MQTQNLRVESPERFDLMHRASGGRWALFKAGVTYRAGLALMDTATGRFEWWFKSRTAAKSNEKTKTPTAGLFDDLPEAGAA